MFSRIKPTFLLTLLLLFLNAQQAVAVHAAEHNFHKHVSSCDVFLAAESEQASVQHVVVPAALPQYFETSSFLFESAEPVVLAPFSPRAPPVVEI